MKYSIICFFLFVIGATVVAQNNLPVQKMQLNWKFTQADREEWLEAKVPGCVHTDLIRHQIIEHPFYGTNEGKCQWVGETDWTYETEPFDLSEEQLNNEILRLRFNGLDTYADVFINNVQVLQADNAFRSWEVDAKGILTEQGNVIRIVFKSPLPIAEKKLKELPYPLPYEPIRAVVRKPQFHFGWDWGPKLITCGITKDIELIAYDEARLEDVYISSQRIKEHKAEMLATFRIHAAKAGSYTLHFEIEKTLDAWTTEVKLNKGVNTIELPFEIENPLKWWCNDLGNPNLYTFNTQLQSNGLAIDTRKIRSGIREVKLVREKDRIGESFYFQLNGLDVFAKGANMIPFRFFPGEATEADYRALLQSCKDAHINMIRIWGGGVYEDDIFYDLCDEYGIMVWQDFMFACAMYPGDAQFIASVTAEAEEQTIRLRNHPCIALWCGNNENAEGWERWGWQRGLSDKEKTDILKAYSDVFQKTLPDIVKKNTSSSYWESSPRYGRADKRSFTEGDSHYWGLWHDEEPFEGLLQKVPRFMSEYGMQSFPSDEVLREMMVGDDFSFDNPGVQQHQKHNRGFKLMDKYMQYWYPKVSTDSLLFYSKMTQEVQAEGIGMGIEAHRRAMPRCMGTLYWQLNDVWPSFSWSGMDYKGNAKRLHEHLKVVYAPQLISCIVEDEQLYIYWISDNFIKDATLHMQFTITEKTATTDDYKVYESESKKVKLVHGSSVIHKQAIKDLLGKQSAADKIIQVTITDDDGQVKYDRKQKLISPSPTYLTMPRPTAQP
jgi:beta-mannosidase